MTNKEIDIKLYNKLVTFLYECSCSRRLNEQYSKELQEFKKAGIKLQNAIEKCIK